MSALTTGTAVDISRSLFSWPPNPALTIVQIVARSGLLLNNVIGVALCFAAGAQRWDSPASFYIGGSFAVVSLLLVPIILIWNIRMLRNSSSGSMRGYERLESNEMDGSGSKTSRLGMLMFATSIDLLGLLGFLLVFPFTVVDAADRWYGADLLTSYASVTCLPPFVIHAVLLLTQLLQLHSATKARRAKSSQCPHCKHNMQDPPRSPSSYSTADDGAQPVAHIITRLTQDSLVDADDDNITVVNMAPGQETSTCTRTPRMSSSSGTVQRQRERAGSSTANEIGEREGDRLIEKSE